MKCEWEASHRMTSSLMYLLINSASLMTVNYGRHLNWVDFREQPVLSFDCETELYVFRYIYLFIYSHLLCGCECGCAQVLFCFFTSLMRYDTVCLFRKLLHCLNWSGELLPSGGSVREPGSGPCHASSWWFAVMPSEGDLSLKMMLCTFHPKQIHYSIVLHKQMWCCGGVQTHTDGGALWTKP